MNPCNPIIFPGRIHKYLDEMMHTRETRKRERDVKERAKARNENLQCALIDACPASHDCMYFCRVSVCVFSVVCRLLCDVSLPKRVPFRESKFASKKDDCLCNTKSQ